MKGEIDAGRSVLNYFISTSNAISGGIPFSGDSFRDELVQGIQPLLVRIHALWSWVQGALHGQVEQHHETTRKLTRGSDGEAGSSFTKNCTYTHMAANPMHTAISPAPNFATLACPRTGWLPQQWPFLSDRYTFEQSAVIRPSLPRPL